MAVVTSEPELSGQCKACLPTDLCEGGLRDGVAKSSTLGVVAAVARMANAVVLDAMMSRAISSAGSAVAVGATATGGAVRSAVAVGATATEGAVSLVWAPPSIWVTVHVATARDPNTVIVTVGATLGVPAVIGGVGRITAGRDPNAIVTTLGVGTGGAEEADGTRTWAVVVLLLTVRLAAGKLGSRRDLVALGLEHIEREWISCGCRGVGKQLSNRGAEGGATVLGVT